MERMRKEGKKERRKRKEKKKPLAGLVCLLFAAHPLRVFFVFLPFPFISLTSFPSSGASPSFWSDLFRLLMRNSKQKEKGNWLMTQLELFFWFSLFTQTKNLEKILDSKTKDFMSYLFKSNRIHSKRKGQKTTLSHEESLLCSSEDFFLTLISCFNFVIFNEQRKKENRKHREGNNQKTTRI